MGNEGSKGGPGAPGGGAMAGPNRGQLKKKGITRMSVDLQKKFQRGLTYNMKVVIRGDSAVGKSALLRRLEGKTFVPDHYATRQIQTANINWSYKTTDDVIKVEVWDVVDKARTRSQSVDQPGPRPDSPPPPPGIPSSVPLDASNIDVYSGAHAVIVMMDPSRKWTFDYVKNTVKDIPKHLDVLLLSNFRDVHERRVVPMASIEQWLRTQPKNIKYQECSVLNCYGLKQIYTFLNIPFLKLKVDSLKKQIVQTEAQLNMAEQEVDLILGEDYDQFVQAQQIRQEAQKGKKTAESQSAKVTPMKKEESKGSSKKGAIKQDPPRSAPRAAKSKDAGEDDDLASFDPGAGSDLEDDFFDEPAPARAAPVARKRESPDSDSDEQPRNPALLDSDDEVDIESDPELDGLDGLDLEDDAESASPARPTAPEPAKSLREKAEPEVKAPAKAPVDEVEDELASFDPGADDLDDMFDEPTGGDSDGGDYIAPTRPALNLAGVESSSDSDDGPAAHKAQRPAPKSDADDLDLGGGDDLDGFLDDENDDGTAFVHRTKEASANLAAPPPSVSLAPKPVAAALSPSTPPPESEASSGKDKSKKSKKKKKKKTSGSRSRSRSRSPSPEKDKAKKAKKDKKKAKKAKKDKKKAKKKAGQSRSRSRSRSPPPALAEDDDSDLGGFY